MRLLSNTVRISQMICICFCLRSSKQHQGPSQNFIRMARSKAVVPPKSQSSSEIKSQGKKKQTKPSLSIVAEPPAPAEISKENKDDEEGPEAEANDGDEEGGSEVEDREEDSEDGGVDRVGMERLMELLGEDGLDDFDRAQLESLAGEDEDNEDIEDDDEGEEDEEVSDGGKAKNHSEAEEGEVGEVKSNGDAIPLDLDEAESIDEDAVPKQKLEIDNQVSLVGSERMFFIRVIYIPGCTRPYPSNDSARLFVTLDRNSHYHILRKNTSRCQ